MTYPFTESIALLKGPVLAVSLHCMKVWCMCTAFCLQLHISISIYNQGLSNSAHRFDVAKIPRPTAYTYDDASHLENAEDGSMMTTTIIA